MRELFTHLRNKYATSYALSPQSSLYEKRIATVSNVTSEYHLIHLLYRRQILTYKVDLCTERVNLFTAKRYFSRV